MMRCATLFNNAVPITTLRVLAYLVLAVHSSVHCSHNIGQMVHLFSEIIKTGFKSTRRERGC